VVTHYWYNRQLKEYRFIRNSKEEFIVVSTIIRVREIPDDYVWLYPEGKDIAHVGSVNHEGKV
jgi:flavin-dependent dehydrogenase